MMLSITYLLLHYVPSKPVPVFLRSSYDVRRRFSKDRARVHAAGGNPFGGGPPHVVHPAELL
ncbi:hypothetical protein, partial [Frankia sp. CcWB2]